MRRMMFGMVLVAIVAVPASATSYRFAFAPLPVTPAPVGGTPVALPVIIPGAPRYASGIFTVTGGHITGISGFVDGAGITGLQSTDGLATDGDGYSLSPDHRYSFDNRFLGADPWLTLGGVLFYASGNEYNLWYTSGPYYRLSGAVPYGPLLGGSTGGLEITAVPEPGSWMMMIAGFGAIGIAARYRTRRTGTWTLHRSMTPAGRT